MPPRWAIERMNTPASPAWAAMRTRSPSTAPPLYGLVGSTASTPPVAAPPPADGARTPPSRSPARTPRTRSLAITGCRRLRPTQAHVDERDDVIGAAAGSEHGVPAQRLERRGT